MIVFIYIYIYINFLVVFQFERSFVLHFLKKIYNNKIKLNIFVVLTIMSTFEFQMHIKNIVNIYFLTNTYNNNLYKIFKNCYLMNNFIYILLKSSKKSQNIKKIIVWKGNRNIYIW